MKIRFSFILLFLTIPSLVVGQSFGYKMITIQTEPSGAELFLNGQPLGESPATVRVQDGLLAPQYFIRVELDGYQKMLMPLDQNWKTGLALTGACCGMLFLPALAILIYAKEHEPIYTIYLQKDETSSMPFRFDPDTGLPIE
ncbi:MAG: PEGA domain-containing protein [Candidatus Marinimicrobia bacterium]|nr:PEGA domain-containing protein [Candidatus Neomarinimicrobiota bacterium]